jgi:cytohesin
VLLVGCGESQSPEPPTVKAPDISIHDAVDSGNIKVVKQHLAAGTDVNAKSDDRIGWTPLHRSTDYGHKEIAELLIANGADVNAKATIRNDDVVTPLDWAIRAKRTEIADLIRKHGGKTSDWLNAGKSIHIATKAGHIEAVKQHLAAGTDVNAEDNIGATPLFGAAGKGHKEIVELLIAEGADVNAKNRSGWTPLHYAAQKGHKEIAKLLIAGGVDVNAKTDQGWIPLHLAAKAGFKEIVELLIAKGADVDAKDKVGHTPVDSAERKNYLRSPEVQKEIADLLRKHGGKTGEELKAEGK